MPYQYFPGCSLKSSGRGYEESLLAVLRALEVPCEELDDWNCCGATAYMAIDEVQAFTLASRNLALAERAHGEAGGEPAQLLAPCAACYLVLLKTQRYLAEHKDLEAKVVAGLQAVQLSYQGRVQVRHPLDVLVNDVGTDRIAARVKQPLKGMKVACYYGCQVVRPFAVFDTVHNPTTMDRLVKALGATPVDWPLKTRCCGGTLMGTIPETGLRLNRILLKEALRRGADILITICPLCQFNLECYQDQIAERFGEPVRLPVIYLTQLMGMAFGFTDKELGIQRLLIPPVRAAAVAGGRASHA
jgi:heterodisulfide reductase subunit B